MDALCSLFDAVACVGELLGRSGEKEGELATLVGTVESVSQSVRAFASDLDASERQAVFESNQVFSQLAKHLRECNEVIAKYRRSNSNVEQQQLEDTKDQKESGFMRSTIKRGLLQSSRTLNEGLEVLSSKLGSFGTGLLRLPEDELAIIRQASQELSRLVPQLNLAISVYTLKGQKRLASPAWTVGPPLKAPALQAPPPTSGDAAAGLGAIEEAPLLRLQLVSDYPAARACELPALTSQELRPITGASSSSLDSAKGATVEGAVRLVFGRQELRDKVPKTFKLPTKTGEAPQPIGRFISRDMFVLDARREPPAPEPQDTMDMATLAFGGAADDAGATLAWGGDMGGDAGAGASSPAVVPLATISGLSSNGLHLRRVGQTTWSWAAKEMQVELYPGDRIALLLESPPGSCVPGPSRDLSAEEAQCLMGLELQRP